MTNTSKVFREKVVSNKQGLQATIKSLYRFYGLYHEKMTPLALHNIGGSLLINISFHHGLVQVVANQDCTTGSNRKVIYIKFHSKLFLPK